MSKEQLVQRFLAAWAQVPLGKVQGHNKLNLDEDQALLVARQELEALRIEIDDTPGVTIPDVRARAKRMAMTGPLDLIVVDYLQLMRGTGGDKQPREQQVAEVSRGLKGLAKEMECTVLALAQLNRGVEQRQGTRDTKPGDAAAKSASRPRVSDLRESGSIEQDADIITFIHRDSVYTKDEKDKSAEFIIGKHRAGELGTVHLVYEGPFTRFYPQALHHRFDA
jgi:replicative DNA helicase